MAETTKKTATLTHKVRNPQNLDTWLNIWTAEVSADYDENNSRDNETEIVAITPSEKWKIPINNLNLSPNGEGDSTQFLNQQGEWVNPTTSIMTDKGIIITDDNKIGHSNNITAGIAGNTSNTKGSILHIPCITYDAQGHITNVTMSQHTVTIQASSIVTDIPIDKVTAGQSNSNVIIKTDENGHLIPGPTIINAAATTKFLNQNGQWVESGYTLSSNGTTVKLTKSDISNAGSVQFTGTDISVTGDTNNQINIKANDNTKNQKGIVAAGNGNNQKAWATNNNGEPTWRSGKVTIQDKKISNINDSFLGGFIEDPISWTNYQAWKGDNTEQHPEQYPEMYLKHSFLAESSYSSTPDDYIIVFKSNNALTNSNLENNGTNSSYNIAYE